MDERMNECAVASKERYSKVVRGRQKGRTVNRWASLAFRGNVQGEPVFSVMAAGWFCEKSG